MLNEYKVTFGNPAKEWVLDLTVIAPNEQSAMIEARLDPAAMQDGVNKKRITSVKLIRAVPSTEK